jgi:pentose-5-phosphate-3-epimerase
VAWATWIRTVEVVPAVNASEAADRLRQVETLLRTGCTTFHLNAADAGARAVADAVALLAPVVHRFDGVLDVHVQSEGFEELAAAGADNVTFDAGAFYDVPGAIARVRETSALAGVAFGAWVPEEEAAAAASSADLLVCVGDGDTMVARVRRLAALLPPSVTIAVEGEITYENARSLYLAGARLLVAERTIFEREDLPRAYRRLVQALT